MSNSNVLSLISAFFEQVGGASLKLPTGWFGRPYDNFHRLTAVDFVEDRLLIQLDGRLTLMLDGAPTATVDGRSLRVSGFGHGTWDWVEYGSADSHHEEFDGGQVEFVAVG